MSFRDLFDSLQQGVFKPVYKTEPRYEFRNSTNEDPFATDLMYLKYDQIAAKAMLLNTVDPTLLKRFNDIVPINYKIHEATTYGDFVSKLTLLANGKGVLTKYNDLSDEFIRLSYQRDSLWSQARGVDQHTNSLELSAYKKNDTAAGPPKVSPVNFGIEAYWLSYMISLLQSILLSKSIYDGLIQVEDKFTAMGYLLSFGSGGFRSTISFDPPSVFYQPRRCLQYDVLKQFDYLFQTVSTQSYSLIFSQIIIPLIIIYLYFTTDNIFVTTGIQAQFLLLVVEFKVIQEVMIALKFVFSYNIHLNVMHFTRTLAGEMHDCKMNLLWFLVPGLTTIILILAYCLNFVVYSLKVLRTQKIARLRRLSNAI